MVNMSTFCGWKFRKNPWQTIENYLKTGEFKYFGSTVMPGPQLRQAIPFTKKLKNNFQKLLQFGAAILHLINLKFVWNQVM